MIKDTKGLLEDRYLEAGVDLRMPYEDYKHHKENLEKMVAKGGDEAQKAQKVLDKLNANNTTNRWICENPRVSALILTSGVVWEIKDAYAKHPIDTDTSGGTLSTKNMQDVQKTLENPNRTGKLRW
ncbi:hypothetical protein [Helicobacter ailurogastricus]|uniref:Uncharacterized protein n=1 Tax=Helicobacter ailurogastricus TaxID=1578720 RepID=A0A0K2Y1K9_9HELI|nr:hypothetical protein [Helicobacter ailurogastricus]BDQ28255.1 hypothetical protein ASB7_00920 [Helicobacter ailurogastricus]CRF52793.1 hypothetical protein HAL07_12580 [Helicobacter ailurogastricus]